MDYNNGTHIAKWQWDLIHDPGVVVSIFEKDEDAEKANYILFDEEYFIKDGVINENSFVIKNNYFSITKMKETQTIKSFFSRFGTSQVSNLIFETGSGKVGATSIAFIVKNYVRANNIETRLLSLSDPLMTQKYYENATVALRIWINPGAAAADNLIIAHELLIHGILFLDEIDKIKDLKSLSFEQAKIKISEIHNKASYITDDGGASDHALFITGKKQEMTDYLLERLGAMENNTERWNFLKSLIIGDDGSIYMYVKDTKITDHYKGKQEQLIVDVKKYLETQFKDYHDLIFKPIQGQTSSLWKRIDPKYPE
jgi:hypothetical protein